MIDKRIDFEDCGAFVRIGIRRIAKAHVVTWKPGGPGATHELWLTVLDDEQLPFYGGNVPEVLAALDEAMRGTK